MNDSSNLFAWNLGQEKILKFLQNVIIYLIRDIPKEHGSSKDMAFYTYQAQKGRSRSYMA